MAMDIGVAAELAGHREADIEPLAVWPPDHLKLTINRVG